MGLPVCSNVTMDQDMRILVPIRAIVDAVGLSYRLFFTNDRQLCIFTFLMQFPPRSIAYLHPAP